MNSKFAKDQLEGFGMSGTEVSKLPRVKAADTIQTTGTKTTKLAATSQAYDKVARKKLINLYFIFNPPPTSS